YEVAKEVRAAKSGLLHAQWRILASAGQVRMAGTFALDAWVREQGLGDTVSSLDLDQLDLAAERLGARVRALKGAKADG
ncbi:MAG TPA: hypothetical protein VLL76_03640, partial [Candidatus Omnitrophota bacterium]|nr:hypothetical protein [Candidatus Omnitrophota bacterium]